MTVVALFSTSICVGDMVQELTQRFNDNKTECIDERKNEHPAYMCSGILIRGISDIRNNKTTFAWNFKPGNRKRKSFSVAFLRKDTAFSRFPTDYDSGFILYPHLKTPTNKNTYEAYCAFPLNGNTNARKGKYGCGQFPGDRTGSSKSCDAQGITSFSKWKAHYYNCCHLHMTSRKLDQRQCAFDMTNDETATRNFAVMLEANAFLLSENNIYSFMNNEILFNIWSERKSNLKNIPIEAFWYVIASRDGRAHAKKYQIDYYLLTGEMIPIVGIRLPTPSRPIEVKMG